MTQDEEDRLREADLVRSLDKAHDRALLWKRLAVLLFLILVWVVAESRGCFGGERPASTETP